MTPKNDTVHQKQHSAEKAGQNVGNDASVWLFFCGSMRQKIGRVPYLKSTGRPLFLPGGIW
jgi:hypothetical protein